MQTKIAILIFSLIGFSFSLYLYLSGPASSSPASWQGGLGGSDSSFCTFGGCNSVLNSKFSKTLGIDNSLLGVFYFLMIGALTYLNKEKFLKILSVISAIFALYLIFVMLFILKELCYYCLIVDVSAIIIFVLSYDFRKFLNLYSQK
jgi:uncharacterized membrane protein